MYTLPMSSITPNQHRHIRIVMIIFAIFVCVNIVILGWFFITKTPGKISPLFSYVDARVQQTVLLRSDRILDLLGDEVTSAASNPIFQTLLDSNNIGLLQFTLSTGDASSAIIVDAKKSFDPNQFLSVINTQGDTDYSYKKYDASIYLFATPDTIDQLSTGNTLLIHTDGFTKIRPLVAGQDIVVISRVDQNAAPIADENIAQFVSHSEAFVIGLTMQKKSLHLDASLLYKNEMTGFVSYTFIPKMTDAISDQTMAFVETNAGGFLKQENRQSVISGFRAYDPMTFADISDDDIRQIMSSNIALIAQNSATFSDLRLALLMGTDKIYPIVSQVFPSLQEPLAALAGLDPSMLQAVQEDKRIAYNTTLFGLVPVALQAYAQDDRTVISLGSEAAVEKSNTHKIVTPSEGSIAYIFIQFDPILQLYRQFGTMLGQNVQDPLFLQQEKLLKGKTWAGYIQSTKNGLSLRSIIE